MKKLLLAFGALFLMAACNNSPEKVETKKQQESSQKSTEEKQSQPATTTGIPKLDSINKILAKEPANINALAARAQLYVQRGDNRKALFDLLQARETDSLNPAYLEAEGNYRMAINQSRKAKEAWTKCAQLDPKNTDCRLSLGKIYHTVGEQKKALDFLNQAIDIDPYLAEAYLYKGLVIRDSYKDTAKALEFIQQATELKQGYIEALDVMGVLLSQIGDTLAPYYFKRILKKEPNRADIYYKLGIYYMQQDKLNRAIEAYTQATKIDPKHADSYYNLGFMFIQLKEYQDARDYFSKSINARSSNYKAYYGRGYAHEMLGDVINARKDYRKALDQLPMYKPAQKGLNRVNQ